MNEEFEPEDSPLTERQNRIASTLTTEQVAEIDQILLSCSATNWRKVSLVVATAMGILSPRNYSLPDTYYSRRVAVLVDSGELICRGDLRRMRYSEVKLP